MMLIMLAGLQSQPSDILEAANVDGATPFGIFRQLTLPHLRRYLELGALLGSIYIIQAFDAIDQMTGGAPGRRTSRTSSTRSRSAAASATARRPPTRSSS